MNPTEPADHSGAANQPPDSRLDQSAQVVTGPQTNITGDVDVSGGVLNTGVINTSGGDVVGRDKIVIQRLDPADARNQRDHAKLRQKVRLFWIDGVLKHSLYNEQFIHLNIDESSELVDNRPWDLILPRPDLADDSVPTSISILSAFDQMNQQLLILGEPGSGKTTMLLVLTKALLDRAQNDPTHPTPVVFNLSSWAAERPPLATWLVTELQEKYNIPRKLGQGWVANNELLLLLDGLDEIHDDYRNACIAAINLFLAEHLVALAVCCRVEEYRQMTKRLRLQGAIQLQPLTDEQIQHYLTQAGPALATLQLALTTNPELQELAKSPILLNIMSLAYQDSKTAMLAPAAGETPLQHLVTSYLRRMFSHHGATDNRYPPAQTLQRLRWLGTQLVRLQQTPFLIESLQPNWLPVSTRRIYLLASRVTNSLLLALLTGLAYGLISEMYFSVGYYLDGRIIGIDLFLQGHLPTQLRLGVVAGLCVGLVMGITMTLLDSNRFKEQEAAEQKRTPTLEPGPENRQHIDMVYACICALIAGLVGGWIGAQMVGKDFSFSGSLIFGLSFGLIFGIRTTKQTVKRDVQTVDAFTPSTPNIFKGLGLGIAAGLLFGIISGLVAALYLTLIGHGIGGLLLGLVRGLFFAMGLGLAMAVGGALYWGLDIKRIETTVLPNQGIRLSFSNALRAGAITAPLSIGLFGLVYGLAFDTYIGASIGLIIGAGFGVLAFLWYGGFDVIQHLLLRLFLWRAQHIPWNYAHFLDYCADKIFLHRVGGGYVFIHRLIMEQIAALREEEIAQITAGMD